MFSPANFDALGPTLNIHNSYLSHCCCGSGSLSPFPLVWIPALHKEEYWWRVLDVWGSPPPPPYMGLPPLREWNVGLCMILKKYVRITFSQEEGWVVLGGGVVLPPLPLYTPLFIPIDFRSQIWILNVDFYEPILWIMLKYYMGAYSNIFIPLPFSALDLIFFYQVLNLDPDQKKRSATPIPAQSWENKHDFVWIFNI